MIVHDSWWSNGSARSTIIDYHEPFGQGVTNNFLFNDKHAPSCLIKRKLAECNDFSDWNYIKSSETNKLRQSTAVSADLSTHPEWFSSCFKMKIQSAIVFSAVLILTSLVADTECVIGPIPLPGKREYQKQVWNCLLIELMPVQVSSKSWAKTLIFWSFNQLV